MKEPTRNDVGDWICEHGTAMDVHCCNCHTGFLFDVDWCVCWQTLPPKEIDPTSGLEFCPRCASGPRQKADVDECQDCGYKWAGPRLLDILAGEK